MKKIFFAIAAIFLLTACSDDENEQPEMVSDDLLLTKVTLRLDELTSDFYYNYDGNKLVSESHEGKSIIKYFYTGDLITRIENYDYDNTNLMSVTTNSYDHLDRLILKQVQSQLINTNSRTVYLYNNDNTVQLEVFEMKDDMPEQQIASGILFLDNNGDTMKTGDISGNIGAIYEYDTYKNPFKNVTGYNKMLQYNMYGRFANLTKVVYNTPSPAASVTTISYAYNASGFPKKANFNLNGTLYTKEFFYK